ncbi:MAG: tRNA pseudouridine(38-40) synthase TruA [Acidobacteria bacterium]|nr:tRNA pseudouridine(38-40) synthase TruA [Acidobacteriota bacterium]
MIDDPIPVRVIPDPPAEGRVRLRMEIAYDGGRFRGVAENADVVTVLGSLRTVIERVVGHAVVISVAGRTDAGVHARAQVLSFDVDGARADPAELLRAVNRTLAPAVVAQQCAVAAPDFDARFSAVHRHYRYLVLNRPVPDPFLAATSWWVGAELDLNAMILACDPVLGSHDFSSFCRRPKGQAEVSLVRRVLVAEWHDLGEGLLRFDIRANAFCHQMVRSLVGTMVDMGRGRLRAGEMTSILAARDRSAAGQLAPPEGLCLWEVGY